MNSCIKSFFVTLRHDLDNTADSDNHKAADNAESLIPNFSGLNVAELSANDLNERDGQESSAGEAHEEVLRDV